MKQIERNWGHDQWAEDWEKFVKAEAWCFKWCEYAKVCPITGQPYTDDCQLRKDEENSR